MEIRKSNKEETKRVAEIYDEILNEQEKGNVTSCWVKGVYPILKTAEAAFERNDLYVMEDDGVIVGSAIINEIEPDLYKNVKWSEEVSAKDILVLHTLVISPKSSGKGYGKKFVKFYEDMAKNLGKKYLRMDTNVKNTVARELYKKLGYSEIGISTGNFNGIENVSLVLLEKKL